MLSPTIYQRCLTLSIRPHIKHIYCPIQREGPDGQEECFGRKDKAEADPFLFLFVDIEEQLPRKKRVEQRMINGKMGREKNGVCGRILLRDLFSHGQE